MSKHSGQRISRGKHFICAIALAGFAALSAAPASAQTVELDVDPSVAAELEATGNVVVGENLWAQTRTDTIGLVEETSLVSGGGVVVDLQGSFRNFVIATAVPGGIPATDCTLHGDRHED